MASRFLVMLVAALALPLAAGCMPETPETSLAWNVNDREPEHVTHRTVEKRYVEHAPSTAPVHVAANNYAPRTAPNSYTPRPAAKGYTPRTYVYQEALAPLPTPRPRYAARDVPATAPLREITPLHEIMPLREAPPRETLSRETGARETPPRDEPSPQAWQQVSQPDYQPDYDDQQPSYPPKSKPVASAAGGSGAFAWPVSGPVIADFGATDTGGKNDGINIATPMDTPIRAAAGGSVTYAGSELKDYGNLVLIKHTGGYTTAYAHASRLLVHKGDIVVRGQVIGYAGQTGDVTRPQLHFEIRNGITPVNPRNYLTSQQARS